MLQDGRQGSGFAKDATLTRNGFHIGRHRAAGVRDIIDISLIYIADMASAFQSQNVLRSIRKTSFKFSVCNVSRGGQATSGLFNESHVHQGSRRSNTNRETQCGGETRYHQARWATSWATKSDGSQKHMHDSTPAGKRRSALPRRRRPFFPRSPILTACRNISNPPVRELSREREKKSAAARVPFSPSPGHPASAARKARQAA